MGQTQCRGIRYWRQAVGKGRGHAAALALLSAALKVLAWVATAVEAFVQTVERSLERDNSRARVDATVSC
jgi:hypothetical protein